MDDDLSVSAELFAMIMSLVVITDALDKKGVITSAEMAQRLEIGADRVTEVLNALGTDDEVIAVDRIQAVMKKLAGYVYAANMPRQEGDIRDTMSVIDGGKDDDDPGDPSS